MENTKYLCRMCRQELFTEDDLEVHAAGAQHISRRKLGHEKPDRSCHSYFLKETSCGTLGWLGSLSELEGKLACPNARCLVRVGHYNWSGSQCSCGSWVVPAIQVPKSKVDKKDAESVAGTKVIFVDAAAYGDAAPVLDAIAEEHAAAVDAVEQGSSHEALSDGPTDGCPSVGAGSSAIR